MSGQTIAASGTKDEVLEKLKALQIGTDQPTISRIASALADHVDLEIDGGNRQIDVSVSIHYGMG